MDRPPAPPIPLRGEERPALVAFLEFYRAALLDRAFGLDAEQLQTLHPPTSLTLSRLIGHMAYVEEVWFRDRFMREPFSDIFATLDWDADPDAEMTMAQTWSVEELLARFEESVAHSRRILDATESLDQVSSKVDQNDEAWDMRWILIHMIEEYARHCGHADLIRESIDGNRAGD